MQNDGVFGEANSDSGRRKSLAEFPVTATQEPWVERTVDCNQFSRNKEVCCGREAMRKNIF